MLVYTLENIITGKWITITEEDNIPYKEIYKRAGLDPSEWKVWDTIDPEADYNLGHYW